MRFFLLILGAWLLGCAAAGAAEPVPATMYFPVLPADAPADALPQLVPMAANRPMDSALPGVTRGIVVIHDEARDANAALATVSALAGSQNASTIIFAPQFLLPSDIVRYADYLPEKGQAFAAWQVLGWTWGDDSMPVAKRKGLSSFTVIDLLSMYLSDKNAFPDLKDIVIVGVGVGANFVQRYAAFTNAVDVVAKQGISVRFVIAGASSYVYQTASRPQGGKKGFGLVDPALCPRANAYPYGMENLNTYARRTGANTAKINYGLRQITYVYARAPDAVPDGACSALAEGPNGVMRTENYKLYLRTIYGEQAEKTQVFVRAKGRSGDAASLLSSPCAMAALFGDGLCPASERGEGNP